MAEGREGNEKLWEAVKECNELAILPLMVEKIDPNYKKNYQGLQDTSLLMLASSKGNQSIVQLLINREAEVNDANEVSGRTCLPTHHKLVLNFQFS
jgi:ankyrin repeat protein